MLLALLARAVPGTEAREDIAIALLDNLVVRVVLPLVSLLIGTAVLGAEVDDGTIVFLLVNPVPRWEIVAAKLFVAEVVTLALLVPVTALSGAVLVAGLPGVDVDIAVGFTVGVAVGAVVYVAIFVAMSVVTSRALVLGLAYVLIWEGFLASLFAGTRNLSVREYTLSIAQAVSGVDITAAGRRSPPPSRPSCRSSSSWARSSSRSGGSDPSRSPGAGRSGPFVAGPAAAGIIAVVSEQHDDAQMKFRRCRTTGRRQVRVASSGVPTTLPRTPTSPSSEHRCRSAGTPVYVELAHQGTYCLTSRYVSCPRYAGPDATATGGTPPAPAPPAAADADPPSPQSQPQPAARASYTLAARGGFGALASTPRGWVPVQTSTAATASRLPSRPRRPASPSRRPPPRPPSPHPYPSPISRASAPWSPPVPRTLSPSRAGGGG